MPRKVNRKLGRSAWVGVAFFFSALLVHFFWPGVFSNFIYQVATPVVRGWESATNFLSAIMVNFDSKQNLARQNEFFVHELADAREKLLNLQILESNLASLEELYGRKDEARGVLAAVLLAPPLSPYDVLILDVGLKEGISIGSVVRSVSGVPLGKITEVFRDFSRAELFSSPGNETAVRIGEDNAQARAIGVGNGEFQLLLPRELKVSKGDVVIFPELSPSPLGVVESIDFQETDFLQLISFMSPVNIQALSHVLVEYSSDAPLNEDAKETP